MIRHRAGTTAQPGAHWLAAVVVIRNRFFCFSSILGGFEPTSFLDVRIPFLGCFTRFDSLFFKKRRPINTTNAAKTASAAKPKSNRSNPRQQQWIQTAASRLCINRPNPPTRRRARRALHLQTTSRRHHRRPLISRPNLPSISNFKGPFGTWRSSSLFFR